jgi:hypothetical protein
VGRSNRRVKKESLYNLYPPPGFITMIKSRGMRWARDEACMEKLQAKFRKEGMKEKDQSEELV